jgi:TolA-binding protein
MIDIAQIEKQIAVLEKQLSGLHSQRLAALEQQVRDAQNRIQALTGGARRAVAPVEVPSARAIAPVEPAAPRIATRGTRGRPAKTGPKAGAKKKRTRMPSDLVNEKIINTVKEGGSEGLSQKEISVRSGVNYQTTAKKLRELAGIVKKGSGKEARYSFKG